MSDAARVIRRYLDDQGGSTDARVHHLLSTFEVDDDAAGRERIVAELSEEGVRVDRPLEGLGPDEQVVLSAPSRPAWERPAPDIDDQTRAAFMSPGGAEPTSDPPEKDARQPGRWRRRRPTRGES